MKIDPSQLSAPLAHILKTKTVDKLDAAGAVVEGGSTSTGTPSIADQLEQLDASMLQRMRQSAEADATNSLTSVYEARARAAATVTQILGDSDGARTAAGSQDADRVRGLLA
ncbi:MAG: hypothetical protein H7123_02955 [Thermoleophilia bacterium]|nr:hypothetical protein [Thermoleophilia bacterium]